MVASQFGDSLSFLTRHSRVGGNPRQQPRAFCTSSRTVLRPAEWIPAYAGMTRTGFCFRGASGAALQGPPCASLPAKAETALQPEMTAVRTPPLQADRVSL